MERPPLERHEQRYRNSYCLCCRPYLYRSHEEQGVWRCALCGGIRYAIPEHRAEDDRDACDARLMRERLAAVATVLFLIALLTLALYKWYQASLPP